MLYVTLFIPVLAIASIIAGIVYGATSEFHHQSQTT
jgi:hypothetical protein